MKCARPHKSKNKIWDILDEKIEWKIGFKESHREEDWGMSGSSLMNEIRPISGDSCN